MGKKVNLPLFEWRDAPDAPDPPESARGAGKSPPKKPSIDAARSRLGGRALPEDEPPPGLTPGVAVAFAGVIAERGTAAPAAADERIETEPARKIGVILFACSSEVHVLLDGVRLRRAAPQDLEIHSGEVAIDLEKIAADARLFGHLGEGQAVRYADDSGNLIDGKVVEKCRWGALVLRDDGAIVAVGFRKLWPSASHGAA